MAKGKLNLGGMKNLEVNIGDGVDVKDTDMLSGVGKDSAVMNESNSTKQYKTANLPKGELGDHNNLNG
jgi:hypothetical protein